MQDGDNLPTTAPMRSINLADKLSLIETLRSPRIIAEVNGFGEVEPTDPAGP